jgi:hypothetical protein
VQDPTEAMYAGMPARAIASVAVEAIAPSELVAGTIAAMVKGEDPPPGHKSDDPEPHPAHGAPGTTPRRVSDTDEDHHLAECEGAA